MEEDAKIWWEVSDVFVSMDSCQPAICSKDSFIKPFSQLSRPQVRFSWALDPRFLLLVSAS